MDEAVQGIEEMEESFLSRLDREEDVVRAIRAIGTK
jgi:hypothetical protein